MLRNLLIVVLLGSVFAAAALPQGDIDALKQRIENASSGEQIKLSLELARTQLQHLTDYYKSGDNDNARLALQDVETYGIRAANTSTQSGKHQKDTEIAVRKLSYRLGEISRDADFEERPAIKAAIAKIDKAHDELLNHMFRKK